MDIKEKPEDFYVKELIDLELDKTGKYAYFILKKRNYNTLDALEQVAKAIGINAKRLGFAGNKDKRAVTEQYVSADVSSQKIESLRLKDIWVKFAGRGNNRIKIGDNKGNFFRIKFKPKREANFFANYFGEQRFGTGNIEKGKKIVKRDFWDVNEMRKDKNLKMYFHAYQSYLWNKVLRKYLEKYKGFESDGYWFIFEKISNFKIPLISFETKLEGEIGKIYQDILDQEGIKKEDFLVRQFPNLISDTVYRDAFCEVKDFRIDGDYVEFSLCSGSYATVFLRKIR